MILNESVVEAQRLAVMEMKNKESKGKHDDAQEDGDDDGETNHDTKLFKKKGNFAHKKGFQSFARKR